MIVDWTTFKEFVDDRSLSIQYVTVNDTYWLKAFDGPFNVETTIYKKTSAPDPSDQKDFEDNYQGNANKTLSSPKDIDNRSIIHTTPRQFGSITYFTGSGDDPANDYNVGGSGGQSMSWKHTTGEATTQTIYIDFNCIENKSFLHAGALQWKDALNDIVTWEVVPKITAYSSGSGFDYTLYGGYLIVPTAPTTGDVDVDAGDRALVEVPLNEAGVRVGAGYFDADWNTTTKQFDNFAPNYGGTGRFNMFAAEVVLDRFANRITLLGQGMTPLGTHDASMFGHNNRGKLTYITAGTDHDWYGNCWLVLHRKKTK